MEIVIKRCKVQTSYIKALAIYGCSDFEQRCCCCHFGIWRYVVRVKFNHPYAWSFIEKDEDFEEGDEVLISRRRLRIFIISYV